MQMRSPYTALGANRSSGSHRQLPGFGRYTNQQVSYFGLSSLLRTMLTENTKTFLLQNGVPSPGYLP